ncbi:MAG: hypothetical protein HFE66_00285 [Clostridiales bacterium]|jgi:hypothetical protein|nr:hypothetical protein [Clostridiales bacterium]
MLGRRSICLLLAIGLAAGLAGCGRKQSGGHTYDTAADFRPEEGELFADVPTGSFDEYTFTILNARTGSSASKMDTDTLEGDTLNETLYRRNSNVEERLNITIEEVRDTPEKIHDIAVASCLADEDKYSAVWNSASYMSILSVAGYLVTDEYLTAVNLSKPWWKTTLMQEAAVDDAQFLFFGDINLSYYDAHSMVGVNMSLLRDYTGLPDPYDLVDSGKWTMDAMLSMMDAVDTDIDGNGTLTWEDLYGTALSAEDAFPLFYGSGVRISQQDEYGMPALSCSTSEAFYNIFMKVAEQLYSRNPYVYDAEINEADGISSRDMFLERHSLFYITDIGSLGSLRDMDDEFGVLPVPKGTEYQENYISYLPGNTSALGIMATGRNLLRTGIILENLAAEGYRPGGMRECYVDSVLSFKYVDDEKSRENLYRILNTGTIDPAAIYNWGGISDTLRELIREPGVFSSRIASIERAAEAQIGQTMEAVQKYR